jgi:hypothetical protein
VIVRILGEGQYLVPDDHRTALATLDDALDAAVHADDEARFTEALGALAAEVRSAGQALADDDFAPSDLVVPFVDATLEETRALLAEPGGSPGADDR